MMKCAHSRQSENGVARVGFIYLGRSPAFGSFVVELAEAVQRRSDLRAYFIVASGTPMVERLVGTGADVFLVDTFYRSNLARVAFGLPKARREIGRKLRAEPPDAVVTLMPHIWSPLLRGRIKSLTSTYATIVHDATPHPGDPTAHLTRWLVQDARKADVVLTLSQAVTRQLSTNSWLDSSRVQTLFHPDLLSGGKPMVRRLDSGRAFRLLFFGRIMAYKGLDQLLDAADLLAQEGLRIELGVAGLGSLGPFRERLEQMGAMIANRWLDVDEVGALLQDYDAMACSHVEASQSGVAALAFGNAMPVIGMPVGGIAEQVIDGETGVLTADVSAVGLADAIRRLIRQEGLYERI
ncbi:MAG: glycosyltransferase family 4 protein, partial [Hyphomicrobiaceae bacterium]